MATLIHNFWDFWELSLQGSSADFLCIQNRIYDSEFFEIKYYNNIRANFLSYFNVNVYFITIIHYLNKQD